MSDSRKPPIVPADIPDDQWPTAIRYARLHVRMSQEELGERVGVGRGTVNAWENGKTPVGAGSQLALVTLFGAKLLDAPPPLDASERAYWRGRVEQIAAHTRLLLDEQHALAQDMMHPPRHVTAPVTDERAEAIAAVTRSAATASGQPAPSKTARRRHQG